MPLGIALWLLGMNASSYAVAATGITLTALGAFAWTDDQHPHNRKH